MNTNRRTFIQLVSGSALALAGGNLLQSCMNSMNSGMGEVSIGGETNLPLRLPPVWNGGNISAGSVNLDVQGASVQAWGFGGSVLAPTIRVRKGAAFSAQLQNQLAMETNIHWHGLTVPANMDGHPKDVAKAGGSFTYNFPVLDRAGTYWYHPHPHKNTARQTYMGMAGLFIVEDPAGEAALGLPSGEFDIPLVLQDKRFQQVKRFVYAPSMADVMTGYLGDTMFVNGVPVPYLDVENGVYRFRILNGATARVMKLGFENGTAFHVIGTDGGLIDVAERVTSVMLSPGERVEILVDFSSVAMNGSVLFKTLDFTLPQALSSVPTSSSGGMNGMTMSAYKQGTAMPVIRFNVKRQTSRPTSIPTTLTPTERLSAGAATKTRTFALNMEMMSLEGGTSPHGGMSGGEMMRHTINGKLFAMERVDEAVAFGTTEIWEFQNKGDEPHPMHVHGTQFQVLSRSIGTLTAVDKGWKDTVLVNPGETVQVILRFDKYRGLYLVHCHNLEHEDDGMMLNFQVV